MKRLHPGFAALAILCVCTPARAADLSIWQTEPPRSLDPANHTATYTSSVLDPICEGLVTMTPDGVIKPLLATSWERAEDGVTWRFRLRHGVSFHDGTPFNAHTALPSFQRLLSPASSLAGGAKLRPLIENVSAEGDDTLLFHLTRPYAFFLVLLALEQSSIVSPHAIAAGTLDRQPVGTGPYRFVSEDAHERVRETRFAGYWGKPPPYENLIWDWSAEPSVLQMALLTGNADVVSPLAPLFVPRDEHDPAAHVVRHTGGERVLVFLNITTAVLADPRVRKALDLATDRSALVAGLLMGQGQPTNSLFDAATTGDTVAPPAQDTPSDPLHAARRLLAESGHGSGIDISMVVQNRFEPVAEALQAMWLKIGVRVHIRRLESGVWTDAAFASPERKRAMGIDTVIASWSAPFNSDMQTRFLLKSDSSAPAGANLGFFHDSDLDTMIDAAASETDDGRRRDLYRAIDGRVRSAMPVIPLFVPDDLLGVRADLLMVPNVLPGGELRFPAMSP